MRAGKTAIVTGSTSGIGLGIATALAGQGANIVLNGFGPADEIEKIVSDLKRQHNVGVMYSSANIADPDEIEDMVDQTRAEFGGVDILVNNAGIQHVDPIEEFPVDKWNAIIAINLSGAFHTCRLAVPDMKKNGWGRIVNVASAHALVASPFKCFGQARACRIDQDRGPRIGGTRRDRQCDLPRLCPDAARSEANSRAGEGPRDQRRSSDEGCSVGGATDQTIRRSLADRSPHHIPLLR
jgi:hypothetical protein